jgi:hypothetical protein
VLSKPPISRASPRRDRRPRGRRCHRFGAGPPGLRDGLRPSLPPGSSRRAVTDGGKPQGSKGSGASPCQTAVFNTASAGLATLAWLKPALRTPAKHSTGRPERCPPDHGGQAPRPFLLASLTKGEADGGCTAGVTGCSLRPAQGGHGSGLTTSTVMPRHNLSGPGPPSM